MSNMNLTKMRLSPLYSAVNLYSMQQLYNIGLAGVIAVGVTGIVWAVTTDVEHDL